MEHAHLALYENVAEITRAMADAARSSNWDRLLELEQSCERQVACITDLPAPALSHADRERKAGFIREILEHDRTIRDHTVPWMKQLGVLIGNVRNERKLLGAYR
jgi:flagellar protein FliT